MPIGRVPAGAAPGRADGKRHDSGTTPVEAVVFDVGRVIVQWELRHLLAQLVDDRAECDWVLAHVITEDWHYQADQGRFLDQMVPERKALFPQYAQLIDAYATRFVETIPGRVPGTAELIERLAARDVPLYAITNFGAEFWKQFRPTEPVLDHMRAIVVSGQEQIAKPDPAIFRIAADRFGHAPGAMMFIDDNADNIAAARALGWHAHHFTDADTLEAELAERGLL